MGQQLNIGGQIVTMLYPVKDKLSLMGPPQFNNSFWDSGFVLANSWSTMSMSRDGNYGVIHSFEAATKFQVLERDTGLHTFSEFGTFTINSGGYSSSTAISDNGEYVLVGAQDAKPQLYFRNGSNFLYTETLTANNQARSDNVAMNGDATRLVASNNGATELNVYWGAPGAYSHALVTLSASTSGNIKALYMDQSGDTIVVEDTYGGGFYVLQWNGSGYTELQHQVYSGQVDDRVYSVALSDDGLTLAIGREFKDVLYGDDGMVDIWTRADTSSSFTVAQTITPETSALNARFGGDMALSPDKKDLVISNNATSKFDVYVHNGSSYVYTYSLDYAEPIGSIFGEANAPGALHITNNDRMDYYHNNNFLWVHTWNK